MDNFINSVKSGEKIDQVRELKSPDKITCKDLRKEIPKLVQEHFFNHGKKNKKRRGMWKNGRPFGWDDNVPYFDPGNGKDFNRKVSCISKGMIKPKKSELLQMYTYLYNLACRKETVNYDPDDNREQLSAPTEVLDTGMECDDINDNMEISDSTMKSNNREHILTPSVLLGPLSRLTDFNVKSNDPRVAEKLLSFITETPSEDCYSSPNYQNEMDRSDELRRDCLPSVQETVCTTEVGLCQDEMSLDLAGISDLEKEQIMEFELYFLNYVKSMKQKEHSSKEFHDTGQSSSKSCLIPCSVEEMSIEGTLEDFCYSSVANTFEANTYHVKVYYHDQPMMNLPVSMTENEMFPVEGRLSSVENQLSTTTDISNQTLDLDEIKKLTRLEYVPMEFLDTGQESQIMSHSVEEMGLVDWSSASSELNEHFPAFEWHLENVLID